MSSSYLCTEITKRIGITHLTEHPVSQKNTDIIHRIEFILCSFRACTLFSFLFYLALISVSSNAFHCVLDMKKRFIAFFLAHLVLYAVMCFIAKKCSCMYACVWVCACLSVAQIRQAYISKDQTAVHIV